MFGLFMGVVQTIAPASALIWMGRALVLGHPGVVRFWSLERPDQVGGRRALAVVMWVVAAGLLVVAGMGVQGLVTR